MTAGRPISARAASVLSGQLTLIERGAGMPSSRGDLQRARLGRGDGDGLRGADGGRGDGGEPLAVVVQRLQAGVGRRQHDVGRVLAQPAQDDRRRRRRGRRAGPAPRGARRRSGCASRCSASRPRPPRRAGRGGRALAASRGRRVCQRPGPEHRKPPSAPPNPSAVAAGRRRVVGHALIFTEKSAVRHDGSMTHDTNSTSRRRTHRRLLTRTACPACAIAGGRPDLPGRVRRPEPARISRHVLRRARGGPLPASRGRRVRARALPVVRPRLPPRRAERGPAAPALRRRSSTSTRSRRGTRTTTSTTSRATRRRSCCCWRASAARRRTCGSSTSAWAWRAGRAWRRRSAATCTATTRRRSGSGGRPRAVCRRSRGTRSRPRAST